MVLKDAHVQILVSLRLSFRFSPPNNPLTQRRLQDKDMKLLIGTGNAGKAFEISNVLKDLDLALLTLKDFPNLEEVEESGITYGENATLKAEAYSRNTGLLTLADDSGFEVEALRGAPGVISARYAGGGASDQERIDYLLAKFATVAGPSRRARFVSVVALAHPEAGLIECTTGTCEGVIIDEPRGSNGFGYDPIFVPEGFDVTFAELPSDVKDSISHRGKALAAMKSILAELMQRRGKPWGKAN